MNVLILHPLSQTFLTSAGQWSAAGSAVVFGSARDAIIHCERHVRDTNTVILRFGECGSAAQSIIALRLFNPGIYF